MKKCFKLAVLFLLTLTLFACGKKKSYNGDYVDKGGIDASSSESAKIVIDDGRKIIYNVYYSLEAKDIKNYEKDIEKKLNEYNGYIETMETMTHYSSCTYRVPKTKLDDFVSYIDSFDGLTNSKRVKSEDVSTSYNSKQARKEVLEASRTVYVNMLSKEGLSVSDIIAINDKIEKIDVELRQIYLDIDTYDSLIDYSTVTITYYEQGEYEEPGFFDEYGNYISGFFITIGKVILYLLPIAALGGIGAVIAIVCVKHHKNKNKKNTNDTNNKE